MFAEHIWCSGVRCLCSGRREEGIYNPMFFNFTCFRKKRSLKIQTCCTCLKQGRELPKDDRKVGVKFLDRKQGASKEDSQNVHYTDSRESSGNLPTIQPV